MPPACPGDTSVSCYPHADPTPASPAAASPPARRARKGRVGPPGVVRNVSLHGASPWHPTRRTGTFGQRSTAGLLACGSCFVSVAKFPCLQRLHDTGAASLRIDWCDNDAPAISTEASACQERPLAARECRAVALRRIGKVERPAVHSTSQVPFRRWRSLHRGSPEFEMSPRFLGRLLGHGVLSRPWNW